MGGSGPPLNPKIKNPLVPMFAPYGSQSSPMGMAATSAATPLYLPPSPSASHGMHVGRMSWDVLGVMQGGIMALQLYMLTLVS